MRRGRFALLIAIGVYFQTIVGGAFILNNFWPDGDNIVMDDVLLPASVWSSPAQFQMSEWNQVDTTNNSHPFRVNNNPQFSFGANDGDNTIGFLGESGLNSEYGLSYSNALAWAVCWRGFFSGRYDECDVMLDPTLGWSLGPHDRTWFQSTVLHELGHVRGLAHENRILSIENSGQSKFLRGETLYMDDKEGVRRNASHVTERDIVIYNKWHNGSRPRWMSMSPRTLREGDTVNLSNITVENRGTQAFGNLRFGTYLSTNSTISTGDQLLNTGSFSSFGRFTFSTFNWSARIPTVNDCGTRYLGGIIDDNRAYNERFEGNNATVFTNGVPFVGNTFTPTALNIRLRRDALEPNNSRAQARAITLPFSRSGLSIDQDSENDYYRFVVSNAGRATVNVNFSHGLGNINLRLLNSAGTTIASSLSTTNNESIARDLTPGTYYIRVYGAGSGSCNKYSINANFVRHRPDLHMRFLNAPASAFAGDTVNVANLVRNAGRLNAGTFRVGFYLSTNNICSLGDVFLTSRTLPSLAAGASSFVRTPVTIPPAAALGTQWLCAIADDQGSVTETVESNNSRSDPMLIRGRPDLIVSGLNATATARLGDIVNVAASVRNIGRVAVGASRLGFYLSDDAVCTTGDRLLRARLLPGLAVNGSISTTTPVAIPLNTIPGNKVLCAIADDLNAQAESNENNNTRRRSILVVPNPVPTVNLKLNGLDPVPPVVQTTGPARLTLDMAPNGVTQSLDWYVGIVSGGSLVWVTPSGLSATAAPFLSAPPMTLMDRLLSDSTLSPGNHTFVFYLVDGSQIVASDFIVANVIKGNETD